MPKVIKRSAVQILKDLEKKPAVKKPRAKNPVKKPVVAIVLNKSGLDRELQLILNALSIQKYTKARYLEIKSYAQGMIMGAYIIGGLTASEKAAYTAKFKGFLT